MSHLNMGPNPLLDKLMREWSDEVKNRYRIHLIEPAMKPRITFADEDKFAGERAEAHGNTSMNTRQGNAKAMTSPAIQPLSLWARAWLKVAKGIIG